MKRIVVVLILIGSSLVNYAQERIINFHSDIVVNNDRSIDVVETIKVYAAGNQISRGIFRDIPTIFRDDNGRKKFIDLEVKEILKNGVEEPYSSTSISNGRRLRIGDAEVYLETGEYEYVIAYNMSDQVRFFDEYDEIYWNVTGNYWQFIIEKASAKITLPSGAIIKQYNAYTGKYGNSGNDFKSSKKNNRTIRFNATRKFDPYEGLTVAVGWQKGIVPPPTEEEIRAAELEKYKGAVYGGVGVLIIFIYLLWAWYRVGIDPKGGTIIPLFNAPKGYSPSACRYVMRMGFDNTSFAASLVSMGVKGFLSIDDTEKKYKLHKLTDDESMLSSGERKIAKSLFPSGKTSIEIDSDNHSKISGAIMALNKLLEHEFKKINFTKNGIWMIPAILLTIATCITMLVKVSYDEEIMLPMMFGMIVLFFVTIGVMVAIRKIRNSRGWRVIPPLIGILIPIGIFVVAPINIVIQLDVVTMDGLLIFLPYLLVFVTMITLLVLFFHLIKAPTIMGRKVLDEIEGLKLFMEVAEKDRLNMLNPPDKTPQLFEKLLPYAIALGVENQWGEQFESIIAKAIESNEYKPTWYVGDMYAFSHVGRISNNLGSSFSSSLSSASISPQSSSSSGSSFGGGGFSGGGGGGGGGGGW